MSIEVAIFLLRLFSGLILVCFLLALFVIIWRSLNQVSDELEAQPTHGALLAAIDNQTGDLRLDKRFTLLPNTTLGKSASNAIIVDDESASAFHARIFLNKDEWWLADREPGNGTLLNDEIIQQRAALSDGDVIRIGRCSYRLMLSVPNPPAHKSLECTRQNKSKV